MRGISFLKYINRDILAPGDKFRELIQLEVVNLLLSHVITFLGSLYHLFQQGESPSLRPQSYLHYLL